MNTPGHIIPTLPGNTPSSPVAHSPAALLTRNRPHAACPLCIAGRCWQHVQQVLGGELVTHGVQVA